MIFPVLPTAATIASLAAVRAASSVTHRALQTPTPPNRRQPAEPVAMPTPEPDPEPEDSLTSALRKSREARDRKRAVSLTAAEGLAIYQAAERTAHLEGEREQLIGLIAQIVAESTMPRGKFRSSTIRIPVALFRKCHAVLTTIAAKAGR